QILGLAAQAIGKPRPQGREAIEPKPRVLLKGRGRVVGRLGHHRVDDRQFVSNFCQVWKQVRNPQPALASLPKLPITFAEQADLAKEYVGPLVGLQGPAVQTVQLRLVVERIDLAQSSAQTDVNGSPRPGRMMRRG